MRCCRGTVSVCVGGGGAEGSLCSCYNVLWFCTRLLFLHTTVPLHTCHHPSLGCQPQTFGELPSQVRTQLKASLPDTCRVGPTCPHPLLSKCLCMEDSASPPPTCLLGSLSPLESYLPAPSCFPQPSCPSPGIRKGLTQAFYLLNPSPRL